MFKAIESNNTILKWLIEAIDWAKKEANWDGLFVRHTVSELLWGYEEPILSHLHKYHKLPFIPDENPIFAFAVSC